MAAVLARPLAESATPPVKYLDGKNWNGNATMVTANIRFSGAEFGKVYEFPESRSAATARDVKEAPYPDSLLAVFAAALALLIGAAVLGVAGYFAENDKITYWGMAAGLLGGIAVLYSARRAKQFL